MTDRAPTNIAASVRRRLLNRARAEGRVFQELATLYAMERFLFRLGRSDHVSRFVLKGGLMTLTWAGEYARVTRDIDLLGRGANSVDAVVERIREIAMVEVDDGVRFDLGSVRGSEITVEAAYAGARVSLSADLSGMLLKMQVDVGFGDAVVPAPTWVQYPQLLDFGAPRLLGYPAEATLAEKLHAVVVLGLTNSRLKDERWRSIAPTNHSSSRHGARRSPHSRTPFAPRLSPRSWPGCSWSFRCSDCRDGSTSFCCVAM